ncbi:MAG: PAS domain S-box protein [Deltaproteobacteria bacterium]
MKIKFQFKKIIGISPEYILEHRILNAITVVAIIVSFLSCILNYLTQMPVITIYGAFLIAIGYISLFLYSVTSKNFSRYYNLVFSFIIFIYAPVFWIINAGSLGGTAYFLILTLVLINITSKNNANLYFSIILFLVITVLLIIENEYPQIIIGYPKKEDRLIDIFVGLLLVVTAIIISLKMFMNIYRNALKTEVEQKTLLNQEEEKFRKIVNTLPQFVSIWSLDMRCTYVSSSVLQLTGYTPEERLSMSSDAYIVPESIVRLENVLKDAMIQEQGTDRDPNFTVTCELEQIRKDGSSGTFESTYTFLRDESGAPISILAITADITDHKRAEDAMRRSEGQYRLLAENSDDVIWTTDTELRFTYISPSSIKLRGVTVEEAMNEKLEEIMTPESLNKVLAEYSRLLPEIEQGKNPSVRVELEEYRKDGSTLWVEVSMRPMRDDEGHLIGYLGVTRDISEHKQMDALRDETAAALRRSEEQYRLIAENSDDVIFTLDQELRFTYMSPSSFKLRGVTAEEAMLEKLEDIMTPESLNRIIAEYGRVLAEIEKGNKPTVRIEIEQYRKDRSTLWVEISIKTIMDGEGHLTGFLGVSRDISEHKLAEEAIQASEEKLRQIINNIPHAVSILDMNMRPTYASTAIQRILGYKAEELLTLTLDKILTPESLEIAGKSFQEALDRNGHGFDPNGVLILNLEQYHKNGSKVLLENAMTFLRNANGVPVGILSVSTDITERKRAEAALQASKESAEAANRSKSVFLANMSHEIRTPMNAILGFAQLMKRDRNLSPQSLEHLEIINRSGEHLLATINDILEMSKIEAGRTVFVPTTFDLHALIYDLERMFRLRTDSKNLRFLVEKVGHIPQWVKTDEGKLRQVLINLMGNAAKFTEEGGIVLRLGGIDENAAAVNIQFEVEDTGPGMTEGEIGRLFQAFEQTTSGIKSGGTGLGLALSQGFVQIMGGTISVISTVGKGSIFRFKLPVQEDSEENAAKKEAKQRVLSLKPGQNEIRILIADDRETNRQLLLQMLKVVGFATQYAVNGKEAVQMVQKWKPQVVLMDMAMPVMDGYEATRKIKASPNSRNTAIVAVTASAFEEDKKRILAAGADDYLSKPFKDAELFEIIGRLTGAEYLYEETSSLKVSETAHDKVLMCKTVAALPPDLVNQMRAAVESADIDQLNDLVLQLAKGQPLLAKQIQEMAARYEYEALTEIFSPGG